MTAVTGTRPPDALPLNAVFGPTIQGEGPYTGRLCYFIRLGGCNLACTWCDTPDTWDTTRYDIDTENPWTPITQIRTRLRMAPRHALVIISGGEPLMHQRREAFTTLIENLVYNQQRGVHVETNGTIEPTPHATGMISHFTVSPKLANNEADPHTRRITPTALERFSALAQGLTACFKFVARTPDDLDDVDELVLSYAIPERAVWIMPEGTTAPDVLDTHRTLAEHILERGYNTTTRLHTLLWDNERNR